MAKALKCVIGARYGALVVVGEAEPEVGEARRFRRWELLCDCGERILRHVNQVNSGRIRSCFSCKGKLARKHGHARNGLQSAEYFVWTGLRSRCKNPDNKSYARYGGRGIGVHQRWDEFCNFIEDMGPRPGKRYQIDRINNDGNYEPSNCRWVLPKTNARNRHNTTKVDIDGKNRSLAELAESLGVSAGTLRGRLSKGASSRELLMPVRPGQVLFHEKDGRVNRGK